MSFFALLLVPTLLAPQAALDLPPPPAMPVQTVDSSPPGARIEDHGRFDLFRPWLLAQVAVGRSYAAPGHYTIGGDLRLALPVRLYGHGRTGFGVLPTASVAAHTHLRDHATLGLAAGLLERGPSAYEKTSAGLVLVGEAVAPFSGDGGARLGWSVSLLALVRGPAIGLTYTRIPLDSGVSHALLFSLGVDLMGI